MSDLDAVYLERNKVVAALAKCFPSGVARTAIDGWSEDWHGCVYIDLPTGQVSWHFHDSQAGLFASLPPYQGKWDGHDTEEKYRRLAMLESQAAEIENLETGNAILVDMVHKADAEIERLKEDAERWNWWELNFPIEMLKVLNSHFDNLDDKTVAEATDAAKGKS